jgi:hypothetical protein
VLRGVFEGAEGVVTDLRQQCTVVMALSATSRCFSLEVGLENIEVLRKPATMQILGSERQLALSRV